MDDDPPKWCKPITWNDYADKRHERVQAQVDHLLRDGNENEERGGQQTNRLDTGKR